MIDTIKKIQETRHILDRPYPEDRRFIPGHEMAKAEAARNIEKLNALLAEDVAQVAVPVYVGGENAKALAEAMANVTEAAIVDLNNLYGPVFDVVKSSIGRSREFGVSQFALIVREIRQLAIQNGLAAIEVPQFGEPEVVENDAKLAELVAKYASKTVGVELAVNYVRKSAGEQAVKVITEKIPVFPVFILNAPTEQQFLLTQKLFRRNIEVVLDAPSEVNEDAALNSLKTIKKTLKNNKE